ncbi:GIY-YIG nuclease family protein [Methylobacterium sp. 77]|uniref:GIY-YIG nuclease family protein n=1 Tax=Methylobacterium sp. 77 TaxID=1101192 RepID=UPI000368E246|nr:GIY-YIG nuclease family protein [Methylobacterium sp. 77]
MSTGSKPDTDITRDRRPTHVYLIARRVGLGMHAPVRIGVTDDISGEMATVQACSPFEVTLIHAVRFPDGLVVANLLQDKFADRHLSEALGRGWYDMAPAEALTGLLAQLDTILALNGVSEEERLTVLNFLDAGSDAQEALQFLTSYAGADR